MTDWERWRVYLLEWAFLPVPAFAPPPPAPESFWTANLPTKAPVSPKARRVLSGAVAGLMGEAMPRAVLGRNRWD